MRNGRCCLYPVLTVLHQTQSANLLDPTLERARSRPPTTWLGRDSALAPPLLVALAGEHLVRFRSKALVVWATVGGSGFHILNRWSSTRLVVVRFGVVPKKSDRSCHYLILISYSMIPIFDIFCSCVLFVDLLQLISIIPKYRIYLTFSCNFE
jgi:hypothetical protein